MQHNHHRHLSIMTVLSFISMYILMYATVNTLGSAYNSFNQFYMASLMTTPVVLIELLVVPRLSRQRCTMDTATHP